MKSSSIAARFLDLSNNYLYRFILRIITTVAYHVYVCIDNAHKLLVLLARGTQTWIIMASRLLLFTLLLAPAWYRLLKYWFFDPFILRNVPYGQGAKLRNLLDVYLPHLNLQDNCSTSEPAPVVIFVSGGAWIIGYKLWSALVARALSAVGFLVVVPDYRNFPQGDIEDMMADIEAAVQWTYHNCHRFHGRKDRITLAGQSAGAHICLSLLVESFMATIAVDQEVDEEPQPRARALSKHLSFQSSPAETPVASPLPTSSVPSSATPIATTAPAVVMPPVHRLVQLYVGISGPLDLTHLAVHLHQRGLDVSILHWICRGQLRQYSPTLQLEDFLQSHASWLSALGQSQRSTLSSTFSNAKSVPSTVVDSEAETTSSSAPPLQDFPSVALFHGSADQSIPALCSRELYLLLTNAYRLEQEQPHEKDNSVETMSSLSLRSPEAVKRSSELFSPMKAAAAMHAARSHHSHSPWPNTASVSATDTIPMSSPPSLSTTSQQTWTTGRRLLYSEYSGWSHTEAILEAPLEGSSSFFLDLSRAIYDMSSSDLSGVASSDPPVELIQKRLQALPALAPALLVRWARTVNPF